MVRIPDSEVRRRRASLHARLQQAGGLRPGVSTRIARETGLAEAEVHGVASFYHLLADPDRALRVCEGLSCRIAGSKGVLERMQEQGVDAVGCACLAACDGAPALLRGREVYIGVRGAAAADPIGPGRVGPEDADPDHLAIDLTGERDHSGAAIARARELGPEAVIAALEAAGLQGRGGASFPAHAKWRAVRARTEHHPIVVINADEGEPGTFKDREILLRRPDRVLAGVVVAAEAVGAREVYLYLRGEFAGPRRALEECVATWRQRGLLDDLVIELHEGQGAYICGEETALLEALEGRRGMPRLKPPYPSESGLFGRPTLIHNVETIACVPGIVLRGAQWFRALGRSEPGSKLYSVSGHVARPGVYELPLGVCLDELVEVAGGYVGELKAFSPGGASSGFLPACERGRPLDFASLAQVGSLLGSAGVVVLNRSVDMREAALVQLRFFEAESCGQCAPCRIGTRYLRESIEDTLAVAATADLGTRVEEVAWQMREGSICGLGQFAPLPLTSALTHFPEDFAR